MQNNVLVIGNGYDIAHGLETRYDDFIQYIKDAAEDDGFITDPEEREFISECIRYNGFLKYFLVYTNEVPGWVDLERLLNAVVHNFELLFSNYSHFIDSRGSITWNVMETDTGKSNMMRIINCVYLFRRLFDRDDSRSSYYSMHLAPQYYSYEFGLNKREILKLLKQQLDEVIRLLQIYLNQEMDRKRGELRAIPQIAAIDPSYVISFNYTDTYKIYGIKPEDVFHVHGSLDKENMVLGFNDDNSENLDFIYFKKYFQRLQKLTGYMDPDKLGHKNSLGQYAYSNIHFYGHSMDRTDEDIIRKLRTMSAGFVIYTYNQEDYEQKVINLIHVFGKEDAMDMIEKKFIQFVSCE